MNITVGYLDALVDRSELICGLQIVVVTLSVLFLEFFFVKIYELLYYRCGGGGVIFDLHVKEVVRIVT
jgi:hypothetical protein